MYVDVPIDVHQVTIVPVIKEQPYNIDVPKFVTKEIEVEKVKIVPVEQRVEIPFNVDVPVFVNREVVVDKPKFRERTVDIIKPNYVCQKCGGDAK